MAEKIRLIVNALPLVTVRSGIARYVHCLYRQLERDYGHSLDIGYFDGKNVSKTMPARAADPRKRGKVLSWFWRLPPRLALQVRIAQHMKREFFFQRAAKNYDVYHEPLLIPFLTKSPIKTIFTIHDLSIVHYPQFHPKERVMFVNRFLPQRIGVVDHYLTVSKFTKACVQKHFGIVGDNVSVTPLAHDASTFYPRPEGEIREMRERLKLPEQYFLFVGSGDPRKNAAIIPKALQITKSGIALVFAGWSGWHDHELVKDDQCISLGYVSNEDLAKLYSGALALIFPSIYEGFGLPLLEAMACGCPVITTNKASLPEVAGNAALYLTDPQNPKELAALLREVIKPDVRQRLLNNSKKRVSQFSWESTAKKTYEIIKKLCS